MRDHATRTIYRTHGEAARALWVAVAADPHGPPDVEAQVMPTEGGYCVQMYRHWTDHTSYL